jgi:hypothetical protein
VNQPQNMDRVMCTLKTVHMMCDKSDLSAGSNGYHIRIYKVDAETLIQKV